MKDLIKRILKEETENRDLIVPYRLEDRPERYKRIIYKKIQDYIKNGSKGALDLYETPIDSLPSNLKTVGGWLDLSYSKISSLPSGFTVGDDLYLSNTPISEKYTKEQIRKMIEDTGGYVKGNIFVYH